MLTDLFMSYDSHVLQAFQKVVGENGYMSTYLRKKNSPSYWNLDLKKDLKFNNLGLSQRGYKDICKARMYVIFSSIYDLCFVWVGIYTFSKIQLRGIFTFIRKEPT